jgi:hypothetical protein
MKLKRNDRFILSAVWIVLGVMARFLPHPPNVSPMNSISIFGGANLSKSSAFFVTFAAMIFSDILISSISGHAAFGWWTLFTYTGFAAMIFAGSFLQKNFTALRAGSTIIASSLGFWIWTNFGIWITGEHQMYPRTMEGLVACYATALPFLANSLAGDLVWGSIFFFSFAAAKKMAPRFGWNVQGA